jgi:hypothetical protein
MSSRTQARVVTTCSCTCPHEVEGVQLRFRHGQVFCVFILDFLEGRDPEGESIEVTHACRIAELVAATKSKPTLGEASSRGEAASRNSRKRRRNAHNPIEPISHETRVNRLLLQLPIRAQHLGSPPCRHAAQQVCGTFGTRPRHTCVLSMFGARQRTCRLAFLPTGQPSGPQ